MAVTETTAETDDLLTAVTVAETETDCRPTDNDSRSKRSMHTEAVELDHRRRVPGMTDDTAWQAVRQARRMGGSAIKLYQLAKAPPCPPTASDLTASITVRASFTVSSVRHFGVMFGRNRICAVAETRPKPYVRLVSVP